MNVDSGILLHMGLSYVIAPSPNIDKRMFLSFQNALMDVGVDFGEAKFSDREINLSRKSPPLQIRVMVPNQPVGQLVVVAPNPEEDIAMFGRQADAITQAFTKTWLASKQVIACECSIRYLYDSSRDHSFDEIWENRLHQSRDALKIFESPVAGGGLRFVMPALQNDAVPIEKEVKIESFLRDPRKLYVDVRFKWPKIVPAEATFQPTTYLNLVDQFIDEKVMDFMDDDPWSELDLD